MLTDYNPYVRGYNLNRLALVPLLEFEEYLDAELPWPYRLQDVCPRAGATRVTVYTSHSKPEPW